MEQMFEAPKVTLNNGLQIPQLGLGTSYGAPTSTVHEEIIHAVEAAIDCGYRHIDGAWIYDTEKAVGRAIRNKLEEGVVTRQELFITSKLSCRHYDVNDARKALRESLEDLGLDYLDLYLIHLPIALDNAELPSDKRRFPASFPLNQNNDHVAIWKLLEEFVDKGLVRSIGVSNFNVKQIQNILDNCRIKPAINQCEVHVYFQNENLLEYCTSHDIHTTAYAPLGQPKRTLFVTEDWESVLKNKTMIEVAKKYNMTAAQIALRFLIQRNLIVIPKSGTPERILENIQIFDFEINDDDMATLRALNRNLRAYTFLVFKNHKDYPFYDKF